MEAPTLETERLVLRPFVDADASLLADGIFGDPDVIANLPEKPETPEERMDCAWLYIHDYRDPWGPHGWGGWAVTSGDAAIAPVGSFLGFCGFQAPHIDGEGPELGYGIRQPFWGRGIVSEAAARAVDWFFREAGHAACHACHAPWNPVSGRILQKAGLVRREDRDLWDAVARGIGLLPFYSVRRGEYLAGWTLT